MRQFSAIILILAMVFALCGCSIRAAAAPTASPAQETAAPTPSPSHTATPAAETPRPSVQPSAAVSTPVTYVTDDALNQILDGITDNVQPGSAGSSLRAVKYAAQLLDWGMATTLSEAEISSAVDGWMAGQDGNRLGVFLESILSVYGACYDLQQGNAQDLRDSAGCQSSG